MTDRSAARGLTVGNDTFEAPAGTFAFVRDRALTRGAVARTAGTVVLTIAGWADRPFSVSPWEQRAIARATKR